MAEPADINVDELRRRARRRLVGAIVIALGAAVIVPMLLESEPKPLGESVAVKIPPVDDGKFVNRLTDGTPKGETQAPVAKDARKDAPAPVESPPKKSVSDAEKAVIAPPGKPPRYDTQLATDKASAAPDTLPPPVVAAAPAQSAPPVKSEPVPAPPAAAPQPSTNTEAPAPQPPAKAEAPATQPAAKGESPATQPSAKAEAPAQQPPAKAEGSKDGYAVQLAAFSDDKGANALANRLKRSGYPAYTEPLKTSHGTLWRVRVGPYPSRDAANGVRDKLKGEGQNGIVAAAR